MKEQVANVLVLLIRLLTGVRSRWSGCEPSERQRIYFANHTSHIDTLVLWASFPSGFRRRVRPVAAKEYWERTRVRRFLARDVFRAILVARENPRAALKSLESISQELGTEDSLIIFPEGTRGRGEQVEAFHSGLHAIASAMPDIELVPVFLENLNRVLPKGEFLPVPLLGGATFGTPIRIVPGEDRHSFLERARLAVSQLKESK